MCIDIISKPNYLVFKQYDLVEINIQALKKIEEGLLEEWNCR